MIKNHLYWGSGVAERYAAKIWIIFSCGMERPQAWPVTAK
jgi:hypothetical protein